MKPQFMLEDESLFEPFESYSNFRNLEQYGLQKDYKWCALIYPDCTSYAQGRTAEDIIEYASKWPFQEWAYILHDRDVHPDGTPKKPHYHFIAKTSPEELRTFARVLGIPCNYVQRVKNWKKMNQYLIHDENTDKVKYQIEEVVCKDTNVYLKYFDCASESEEAQKILDYIIESGCKSYMQLLDYCCKHDLYATCRRNASMWSNCIREMQQYGNKNY